MKKFSHYAVLGSPIAHSLSPLLYRSAAEARGLDYTFAAIEVDEAGFVQFMDDRDASWGGFSVTMPNKIAALRYATHQGESARLIGAANTLWRNAVGDWCAENTDVDGVLGAFHFVGLSSGVPQQKLLMLGAGGTARAVVYAARDYADEIIIAVRNLVRAKELAQLTMRLGMRVSVVELNAENLLHWCPQVAMVISTLPQGAADSFAREIALAPRLFDVLYHPWPTPIMHYAREHADMVIVGGITMLLYQALSQFTFLLGAAAPQEAMTAALAHHLGVPRSEFSYII